MAEGVRKRGKTWSYYFDTAKIGGERNKIEKGGFKTQKDAVAARMKAMTEYNETGRVLSPSEISVADYLDYWLENAIKKNIDHGYSYNTYKGYESKIRIHIKPAFGLYRLNSFQYSPAVIQTWVDDLKIQGFSKNMIEHTLSCLSTSLNYAVLPLKYINSNPCSFVKIGKIPINKITQEHTEYICSKEEFNNILNRFPEGSNFHLSLLVPYYIGTRIGETFAIDLMQDVDFINHEVNINKQLVKVNRTWFFKPPKYDSYRKIKIGNVLENTLKRELISRKENKLKNQYYLKSYLMPDGSIVQLRSDMIVPYNEIMPINVKDNGELLTPESFKYCSRVIHHELNNPLFHSHCLRHTHGTILAENGVNPKSVMERLGHKNIETTLQVYTFNTESMQQKAVDVFETAVNN